MFKDKNFLLTNPLEYINPPHLQSNIFSRNRTKSILEISFYVVGIKLEVLMKPSIIPSGNFSFLGLFLCIFIIGKY